MTEKQQSIAAGQFARQWADRGYEKGESQVFWLTLLRDVYGVEKPEEYISFESKVVLDHTAFIDGYIPSTKVMIEQKSVDKDLAKAIKQSDGSLLTPFQQAKRYSSELPYSKRPRWIITCNFKEFHVYDTEYPNSEPQIVELKNLGKDFHRLKFIVDTASDHVVKEVEISIKAGEIIGEIYVALLRQYGANDDRMLRMLNILCVRLVFCLYAEDSGVFQHDLLARYLKEYDVRQTRRALIDLFRMLNTPTECRSPYDDELLKQFPYTNGGLFAEEIEIPQFTQELRDLLIEKASLKFDWSEISPTIFGSVFESTLNPESRRSGGMHYTSVANIHKVIDPMFLDELTNRFESMQAELKTASIKKRREKFGAFQDELASIVIFDPACGSGNFLTETYLSLRRLENRVIREIYGGTQLIGYSDADSPIKVSINQFYGIEINDFAVTVATTALWISESQMLAETEDIINKEIDFLPLHHYSNIREGNALQFDWSDCVPKNRLTYIIGNPPFVGARYMSKAQKSDLLKVFGGKWHGAGDLDYVSCWFKKSFDLIKHTRARAALVSTNSISQGGAVANLWKPLFLDGLSIDFAHTTFRWDSEALQKAHVHCVIIGFSNGFRGEKYIYTNGIKKTAKNINGYLCDAPDSFIEKRMTPVSGVPQIRLGGQALDDGNLIVTESEMENLLNTTPSLSKYVKKYMMGKDFINRSPRYCFWFSGVNPAELRGSSEIVERISKVKAFRQKSDRSGTKKAAETPWLFGTVYECRGMYVAIPKVSSERRRYIPIDYLSGEIIPGDKIFCLENASTYHFGILTSNVHMAWMRAVCCRLKSDYSYSNTIVYNNFPWPSPNESQMKRIEQTAQCILDVRNLYPDSTLADLYDELTMPRELRKAHQENDRAVMAAYGFSIKMTESECVGELFKLYDRMTS